MDRGSTMVNIDKLLESIVNTSTPNINDITVAECGEIYASVLGKITQVLPNLADRYITLKNDFGSTADVESSPQVVLFNAGVWKYGIKSINEISHPNDIVSLFKKVKDVFEKIIENNEEELCAFYSKDTVDKFKNNFNELAGRFRQVSAPKFDDTFAEELFKLYTTNQVLLDAMWGKQENAHIYQNGGKSIDISKGIHSILNKLQQFKSDPSHVLTDEVKNSIKDSLNKQIHHHARLKEAIEKLMAVARVDNSEWQKTHFKDMFSTILLSMIETIDNLKNTLCKSESSTKTCTNLEKYRESYFKLNSSINTSMSISDIVTQIEKERMFLPHIDNATTILKFSKHHAEFIDSLFPFRTVLNFRTKFHKDDEPVSPDTQLAIDNFEKLVKEYSPSSSMLLPIHYQEDDSPKSINYGPYYQILRGGEGLDIKQDIDLIKTTGEGEQKRHYIYSAYGYSGSGKTYSLLTSDNSVLKEVVNAIGSEYSLKLVIYDLYGEIDDGGCLEPQDKFNPEIYGDLSKRLVENVTIFKPDKENIGKVEIDIDNHNSIFETLQQSSNHFNIDEKDTNARVTEITRIVRQVNEVRKKNFAEPGWPQMFHIRQTPNNPESSRSHLFIDIYMMRGEHSQGKITIMDMAGSEDVNAIQSDYFSVVKVPDVQIAYNTSDLKTTTNPPVHELPSSYYSDEHKGILRFNPRPVFGVRERYMINKTRPWIDLYNTYKEDMPLDYLPFVIKNDIYIIRGIDKELNFASNAHKNETYKDSFNTTRVTLSNIVEQVNNNNNGIYKIELKNADKKEYVILNDTSGKTDYINVNEIVSEYTTVPKYTDFDAFAKSIIRRVHCPLRFQGNYIAATLVYLKWYAQQLSNDKVLVDDEMNKGLVLKELLMNDITSFKYDMKQKMVLMVNIRLDHKLQKDTNDIRKNNYFKELSSSLKFSHCINPFSLKTGEYYKCEREHDIDIKVPEGKKDRDKIEPDFKKYLWGTKDRYALKTLLVHLYNKEEITKDKSESVYWTTGNFITLKSLVQLLKGQKEILDADARTGTGKNYPKTYSNLRVDVSKIIKNITELANKSSVIKLINRDVNIMKLIETIDNDITTINNDINSLLNIESGIPLGTPLHVVLDDLERKLGGKKINNIWHVIMLNIEKIKNKPPSPTAGGGIFYVDVHSLASVFVIALSFISALVVMEKRQSGPLSFASTYTFTTLLWFMFAEIDIVLYILHILVLYLQISAYHYLKILQNMSLLNFILGAWLVSLLPLIFFMCKV